MHTILQFLSLNNCYAIYVLLGIKYWLMGFEILLIFILFKFKKRPNISVIQVVQRKSFQGNFYNDSLLKNIYIYIYIYIYIFHYYS